jgi:threonylcarbamoyladenosine tRNA methylthiotransferase MtaB
LRSAVGNGYASGVRVTIRTFGCRLNQAESERMAAGFRSAGWQVVSRQTPAEVLVIHGCAVTQTAEQECLRLARQCRQTAQANGWPEPWVVLAGCAAEATQAREGSGGIDLRVPQAHKERLVEIVGARLGSVSAAPATPAQADPAAEAPRRTRALLKVQDGCDFFCSYCIVPHLRGAPVSRPWATVLAEARALARRGHAELVVTGCNLACYRDGARGLADLVDALAALDEVQRVRLGSIEPATVEQEIAGVMAAQRKLCRHLHLPLQSGDAATLRRMGRRYTPEEFAATVRQAVARVPELGVGTDVITGFPGEDEAAFARTREFVAALPVSNLHVFPYSERPGTPAASLAGAVPRAVRKARASEMIRLREAMRQGFARRFVGRPVEVLVERLDRDGCGRGWTGEYLECRIEGLTRGTVGRVVTVTPVAAEMGRLRALPVTALPS